MAKKDYLLDAAQQIRMALDREVNEDYEAAFSYYKNGVDLLLNGVQVDPNKERREAVKRKTTQYLKRAEEIFISYLQDNITKGSTHLGGYSSLRFRSIRHLSSPVENLAMCKVIGIIDKVLTVESLISKETFIVKSLPKSSWESRERSTIIPQGVPFMVKLLKYYVSEDTVFLHLENVQEIGGVSKITEACDWWSLGALLYELLTGMPLWQCHPSGIHPHTPLHIPEFLSTAAASLLTELLQFDACYRLGSGGGGVSDIKCHPFFNSVPWLTLSSSLTP
ncbi:ribosomal protein S6 kinase-like 1 [Garra rufa]|uniref:ribosomal protein S6 kinase-like 1 n=1 Tax=Garra rufa TaxID=137080 RepID=UPI003CCED82B